MKRIFFLLLISMLFISFAAAQSVSDQIFKAAENGDMETISKLILNGADINITNSAGSTPLLSAVYSGNITIVEVLISNGAEVNEISKTGITPLILAAVRGNTDMVKFLLSKGASIDKAGHTGFTPLTASVLAGNNEVTSLLAANNADLDYILPSGSTALMIAVIKDSNAYKEKTAETPDAVTFDAAVSSGYLKTIEALVTGGADIDIEDKLGGSAIIYAKKFGVEIVAEYLQNNNTSGE